MSFAGSCHWRGRGQAGKSRVPDRAELEGLAKPSPRVGVYKT